MNKPSKCKNCQWYGKPYWSIINPCDNCPMENVETFTVWQDPSIEEKNKVIKENASFGKIVCRCEQITEGEILAAIRENPPAKDIDGVKRRTRAGMGRCQAGFCGPKVLEILSRELGVEPTEINKNNDGSYMVTGKTRE